MIYSNLKKPIKMKPYIKFSFVILLLSTMFACQSEPSLQRYFVDSAEHPAFQSLSISPQSFIKNAEELSDEDKAQLENVSKLNVLLLQNKANQDLYSDELSKLQAILKQDTYKNLFSAGEPTKKMEMMYVGEEDQIQEIIFFGNDVNTGFVVVRILGKNLSPNNLYKIMKLGDQLDINEIQKTLSQFTSEQEAS